VRLQNDFKSFKLIFSLLLRFLMKSAVLVFIFGFSLTQAMVIDCYFSNYGFSDFPGSMYTCSRPNISGSGSVSEINGHSYGKSNYDVGGFYVSEQPLVEIPKGLGNFFRNLKHFRIYKTNISSISSSDIQFPKLMYFYAQYNKIISVDGDLFENNPNLVQIDFTNNKIQHVGHDLLTGLNDLKLVNFFMNPCINKIAKTPEQIQELINLLPYNCPPLESGPPITSTTISTSTEYGECSSGCADRIDMVKDEIEAHEKRFIELEKQMREITSSPCSCSK
jgi:hypothetical protein